MEHEILSLYSLRKDLVQISAELQTLTSQPVTPADSSGAQSYTELKAIAGYKQKLKAAAEKKLRLEAEIRKLNEEVFDFLRLGELKAGRVVTIEFDGRIRLNVSYNSRGLVHVAST